MRLAQMVVWLVVAPDVMNAQEKPQPLPTVPVTAEAELGPQCQAPRVRPTAE